MKIKIIKRINVSDLLIGTLSLVNAQLTARETGPQLTGHLGQRH